jgi:hypothetical protein
MAVRGRRNVDLVLLSHLSTGATADAAAAAAGCGVRTVYRRLQQEDFRFQLMDLRAQALERSVIQLGHLTSAAADTLAALLEARAETVRLGAARAIIELGLRLREQVDFEQRLRALESQSASPKTGVA